MQRSLFVLLSLIACSLALNITVVLDSVSYEAFVDDLPRPTFATPDAYNLIINKSTPNITLLWSDATSRAYSWQLVHSNLISSATISISQSGTTPTTEQQFELMLECQDVGLADIVIQLTIAGQSHLLFMKKDCRVPGMNFFLNFSLFLNFPLWQAVLLVASRLKQKVEVAATTLLANVSAPRVRFRPAMLADPRLT